MKGGRLWEIKYYVVFPYRTYIRFQVADEVCMQKKRENKRLQPTCLPGSVVAYLWKLCSSSKPKEMEKDF